MTYKHRWFKKETVDLFGKKWDLTIAAKSYSGKPITDEQRNSYTDFLTKAKEYDTQTAELIMQYINDNCEEFSLTWFGARKVSSQIELSEIVVPKTILFKPDGTTLILLDCPWDEEHGLAVQLTPEYAVGSQDLFL
jgi:hypothetical protein